MDRSSFPGGVEVTQPDLARTETTKREQLLTRFLDTGNAGVATGCVVTPSSTNGRVDVTAGRAYAPNGEMIAVPAAAAVRMADATATTVNLVCAVYDETTSSPGAHETDGTTRTRAAARSGRVEVFTNAQYAALIATNDTDLAVTALDRVAVLASVIANGAAAIPVGNITSPATYGRVFICEPFGAVTGVQVRSVDSGTVAGNAELKATTTGAPGTVTLEYKAPGDGAFGAPVAVVASGAVTLASSTAARTVIVDVELDLLPVNQSAGLTETFVISYLYEPTARRVTADDAEHRHTFGAATNSAGNPHGALLQEVVPSYGRVPQALLLGTGRTFGRDALIPAVITDHMSGQTRTLLQQFGGTTSKTRIYKRSNGDMEVTHNARWTDAANWAMDTAASDAYRLILGNNQGWFMQRRDAAEAAPTPFTDANFETAMNSWPDVFSLSLGDGQLDTEADALITRLRLNFSQLGGADRTLLLSSTGATTPGRTTLRVYRSVASAPAPLELTWNCSWDGTAWVKDSAADEAGILFMHAGQIITRYQTAAYVGTWTDTVGGGGWNNESINWDIGSGGPTNGLVLGGPVQPAAATGSPVANKLYSDNVVKCWGTVSYVLGVVTLADSFNVASAAVTGGLLRVTFTTAMSTTTYGATATYVNGSGVKVPVVAARATTYVDFNVFSALGGAADDLTATTGTFSFMVNARQ